MEPVRPTFWNVPHWAEILQYVLGGVALVIFACGVYGHVKKWRLGRQEAISVFTLKRLQSFIPFALFQLRLSSDPFAFVMHLTIFWGMVVLFLGTILATVDWDVTRLFLGFQFLRDGFYLFYELMLDIFGVFLILGLTMALYRRYIFPPKRLQAGIVPTFPLDSLYFLAILLFIALTGFALEGLRIAVQGSHWAGWSPGGFYLSGIFRYLPPATAKSLHSIFWVSHALLAFIFIASIPFTKAFHIFSSALSIYLRNLSPKGALASGEAAGVEGLSDFTWRQLLQLDACTSCGRCQDVCPAYASGYPLSPRDVVLKLDYHLHHSPEENPIHNSVISAPELWACTTCRACEDTCPVFVEHPRMIVEMRRALVNRGTVEKGLQDILPKWSRYGNSFGQSDRVRAKWTQGLDFKVKDARKEPVEYLWFVGDYASYDPRIQGITQMTARIFHRAGLDFGILYEAERNAGNDVRRIGEEGLFEMLREQNFHTLKNAKFQTIITTDPHTYNTLKNEYLTAQNGKRVVHSTELLHRLMQEGKMPIYKRLTRCATYHDPCYLGRYNGIYEPPRKILKALGVQLIEMPRNRHRSYCCGAGGGRIWMEDLPGIQERPAENRIREAVSLPGVDTFVVACPKDIVMFRDAVKTTGNEEKIAIKDISELVWEAMEPKEV